MVGGFKIVSFSFLFFFCLAVMEVCVCGAILSGFAPRICV